MSGASRHDQAAQLRALVSQLDRRPILRLTRDEAPEPSPRGAPMLAIASGKGGVGKTTLSVNVSIALAQRGLRVTLVDADLGLANADVLCGLLPQRRLEHSMRSGGPTLEQLLVAAPGGFRLVPGAVGVGALANMDHAKLLGLLSRLGELDGGSDVIILDTSAGIGSGVLGLCAAATMTMVVATPEPTSVTDAYALLKCLACEEAQAETALFINQAEDAPEGEAVAARIDAVAARFLGALPRRAGWACRDDEVSRSIRARTPLLLRKPNRRVSRQIGSLAGWVASELRLETRSAQRLRRGRPRLRDRSVSTPDVGLAPIVRRMSVEGR